MLKVFDSIIDLFTQSKREVIVDNTTKVMLAMELARPIPVAFDPNQPYPAEINKTKMNHYYENIQKLNSSWNSTICFGDSILDAPRDQYTEVDEKCNFAQSGSKSNHMRTVIEDVMPRLFIKKLVPKYIIIGTGIGNSLLQKENAEQATNDFILTLNTLRKYNPLARVIYFGVPPTVSPYANANALQCETKIYDWILKDYNSVMIEMHKKFGKLFGTPKIQYTADGVHLDRTGVHELNLMFKKAKTCRPKLIIY